MKKTTEKIIEIKSWFSENRNKIENLEPLARHIKKKGGSTSIKLEIKKVKLQLILYKYKGPQEIISTYMPIKRTTWKK